MTVAHASPFSNYEAQGFEALVGFLALFCPRVVCHGGIMP